LKLLPKLDIKTISYMFTLLGSNLDCNKNIFKFNKNYPSEFGKLCLKETYGQIIYQSQLIDLIYNSDIYYNISKIYGLIKIINKKSVDNYYQFENLVLPDGYKLFDLLTEFTPLYKNSSYPGLLLRDQYKEAYYFLKSSKKFI
ncbi:MAG: hypothetical protein RLZZ175_3066, partial [Bacteroidota bacterium]